MTLEAQGTEGQSTTRLSAVVRRALAAWRSPGGRDSRMIVLIGLNLVALIVAFTMIVLRQVSDTVVIGGEARAERLAKTAAYQLQTALIMVDRGLRYAEREIVRADSAAVLPTLAESGLLPTHMIVMVTFNDTDGLVTATTQGPMNERVRVGDREFVKVHLEGTVSGAYVGRPVVGRISSRWAIPVSRAVHGSDGRLLGVLTAEIDVAAMGAIWRDVGLMSGDVIEVVAPNGEAWIRWPSGEDSLAPTQAQLMGTERYTSYEDVVAGWPLRLRAALDRRRIMAEAAPVQLAILAVAGAGCILVFWFATLLVRKTRQVGIERDAANAAHKRMRAAIDVVPVDFTEFDREGRLVLANQAARVSNPWTVDGEGKTLREILEATVTRYREVEPAHDWNAWLEEQISYFDRAVTQEVRRPNGDWKRIYYADMPGGGRVVLRVDISEIKRREELLEASERRYAELVGSLPDVIISIDQTLRITYASDAAADVLGIAPSRLVGLSLPSMIAPDDRGYVATVLEGMRATPNKAETIVCEFVRGDGATRFMQLKLKSSVAKADSEDSHLSGVIRDIHEQQVLARKLDKEMALLSSIFQSTGAHIIMLDRDEHIVLANQSIRSLLQVSESEIAGMPYRSIPQPGLDARVVERWRAASGSERLESVEFEKTMADSSGKTHILRVTANPVQDDHGVLRYIVLIGVDDTQRRQAEIRLFDASRLANLGEMASGVAHEINQPLAVIRLAAESVAEELEGGPDIDKIPPELLAFFKQKLERIAAQTERASGIIRDLRTVARQPGNVAHPFALSEAVRVGCDLLQEQMRLNRVCFEIDLPTPGPRIMGEAGRLQQVVINLVNNARDALVERGPAPESGQVGSITVRVATDPSTRRVMLFVEDDGPGIPKHVLPRLFEPFFTTKPAGKGTGLGLSISYDIVHRMGGEMTAENRPEGGARFKIGFPPALEVAAEDLRPAAEDLRPAA